MVGRYVPYVMTTESLTADDLTRTDEFTLDESVDMLLNAADSARASSRSDVWAVVRCDTEDFHDVLSAAVSASGVVVHNADRAEGGVSIALEKFADEL